MTTSTLSIFDQKHGTFPEIQLTDTVYEDFTFGLALKVLEDEKKHLGRELEALAAGYLKQETYLYNIREEIRVREAQVVKFRTEIEALKAL
jgi:hypothetical protein